MYDNQTFQDQLRQSLESNRSTFGGVMDDLKNRRAELEERKANQSPLENIDLSGLSRAIESASGAKASITSPTKGVDYDDKLERIDRNIASTQLAQNGNEIRLATAMKPKQGKESFEEWDRKQNANHERKIQMQAIKDEQKLEAERRKAIQGYDNLFVPDVGMALTKKDATDLKSAYGMKEKLDRQLQEMIDLRKNRGTEYWNREDVERGKQLSKDLLLTYKNLAKLGVLSKSDEDIINQIIPNDPLAQDWEIFGDSIMKRLTGFQTDVNDDYDTTVKSRLRGHDGMSDQELEYIYRKMGGN